MKSKQHPVLTVIVLACALLVGCDSPVLHTRPSQESCIQWLHGQKIVVEKGMIFDNVWQISGDTFTAFNIVSVVPNEDGSSRAAVEFEMKSLEKILRVHGDIVYRYDKASDKIAFVSFTPTGVIRMGKW